MNEKKFTVRIDTISKVKEFVRLVSAHNADTELRSGRFVVDAKSIMGIFSLDLSKPIDLNIHAEGDAEDVMKVLKNYTV